MITNSSVVLVRADKPSGTIILNRPDKKNAITGEVVEKLRQAFDDLHQEKSIRAVILTGSGDHFSSGTDLSELLSKSEEADALEAWHRDTVQFCELLEQMLRFPKPIIAAVNGPVLGSAAALMLASDLVISSESASLQFPEPKRGLVPGYTAPLLSFRIGAGQAARLMLTAEKIAAAEAFRIGIYHELVDTNLIWARANQLAETIKSSAPQSLQMIKQMLNETIGEELLTSINIGAANIAAARTTEAAAEGIRAFLEKRPPKW